MTTPKPALPEPDGYFYEVDGYFGIHRQFDTAPYNGMRPHRTVGYFTADTTRAAIDAAVAEARADERQRCVDIARAGVDGTHPTPTTRKIEPPPKQCDAEACEPGCACPGDCITQPTAPARVALSQADIDRIVYASRESDEGPTGLVRRALAEYERLNGITPAQGKGGE